MLTFLYTYVESTDFGDADLLDMAPSDESMLKVLLDESVV